ncbi:MAG TPA: cytochrome c oxidase subunit 3 [Stellaceae bacterium]|jgi:cytochrome c oxidase subunit 3|nr:cytochrome c oxidase subunit 3 [Stellaceae bacterium]
MSVPVLEKQFVDLAHQSETAELGIWGFIATEVLFLGGLFAAYSVYRYLHPAGVAAAAAHTKIVIGSVNTAILLTSSFIMSWASLAASGGESRLAGRLMWIAAALGLTFIGLKGIEYAQEIGENLWPGAGFSLDTAEPKVGEVFYFLYWVMTGIHAAHLLVGVAALAIIGRRANSGAYSRAYHSPVRVVSLYWHFVDVVWIFLFVLIYLPGRSL